MVARATRTYFYTVTMCRLDSRTRTPTLTTFRVIFTFVSGPQRGTGGPYAIVRTTLKCPILYTF